jgi:hypothetical protein
VWEGEEAGIYNDLGEFAAYIVDAYASQDIETMKPLWLRSGW